MRFRSSQSVVKLNEKLEVMASKHTFNFPLTNFSMTSDQQLKKGQGDHRQTQYSCENTKLHGGENGRRQDDETMYKEGGFLYPMVQKGRLLLGQSALDGTHLFPCAQRRYFCGTTTQSLTFCVYFLAISLRLHMNFEDPRGNTNKEFVSHLSSLSGTWYHHVLGLKFSLSGGQPGSQRYSATIPLLS